MTRAGGRTLVWTGVALVAFAANSWLCRLALRGGAIDPASFTALRLGSGALVLAPIVRVLERGGERSGTWPSAVALFVYAACFSLAYVTLDTGTGALVLFGAVQATMIGWGVARGERPGARQLLGLTAALAGLVSLVAAGVSAPPLAAGLAMLAAGTAWGVYSLRGRGASRPVGATAGNFLRAAPLSIAVVAMAPLVGFPWHATPRGAILATVSGAVTSGLGYVVWYAALRGLAATTAGIVQLAVPALAALGGVVFMGERPTLRLVASGGLILGGVALAVYRGRAGKAGKR